MHRCSLDWGFPQIFGMMLGLPVLYAVLLAVAHAAKVITLDAAISSALSFFISAVPITVYYCLSTFACRDVSGYGRVFTEQPDEGCGGASTRAMRAVAVCYLATTAAFLAALAWRLQKAAFRAETYDAPEACFSRPFRN